RLFLQTSSLRGQSLRHLHGKASLESALGRKQTLARRTKLLSYRIANVLALAADRSIEDNLRASSFPPAPPATTPRMVVRAGRHLHRHPRGDKLCHPRRPGGGHEPQIGLCAERPRLRLCRGVECCAEGRGIQST